MSDEMKHIEIRLYYEPLLEDVCMDTYVRHGWEGERVWLMGGTQGYGKDGPRSVLVAQAKAAIDMALARFERGD